MEAEEKIKENIRVIKEQIDKFDSKANILIAIVGIIFAISLNILDIFQDLQFEPVTYILLLIFTVLYFISFILEMIFLIVLLK